MEIVKSTTIFFVAKCNSLSKLCVPLITRKYIFLSRCLFLHFSPFFYKWKFFYKWTKNRYKIWSIVFEKLCLRFIHLKKFLYSKKSQDWITIAKSQRRNITKWTKAIARKIKWNRISRGNSTRRNKICICVTEKRERITAKRVR